VGPRWQGCEVGQAERILGPGLPHPSSSGELLLK
jgi:hypothetical protein